MVKNEKNDEVDTSKTYLDLHLTIDEINIIIGALSNRPFKDVFELIGNINKQASEQLDK